MPSGRRGGSSGSHFGGSRGGSSRSRGSSGRSGSGGSNLIRGTVGGRTVIFFNTINGQRYMQERVYGIVSFLSTIIFFILFFALIPIVGLSDLSGKIEQIEDDYRYYQNMITYAEDKAEAGDNRYIVNARIDSIIEAELEGKYFIRYSIKLPSGGFLQNGYTFQTYTREKLNELGYEAGGDLPIALEYVPADLFVDSIDMEYKNTNLNDDAEYISHLAEKNKIITICTILGAVSLIIIATIIVLRVKFTKKQEEPIKASSHSNIPQQPKKKYCKYCGSVVPEGEHSCKNCGAGIYSESDLM